MAVVYTKKTITGRMQQIVQLEKDFKRQEEDVINRGVQEEPVKGGGVANVGLVEADPGKEATEFVARVPPTSYIRVPTRKSQLSWYCQEIYCRSNILPSV